jgi:hypothetical protein
MMRNTIPSMPVQPIECNDPSSSMFATNSMDSVAPLFQELSHADASERNADNQSAIMGSLSLGHDPHSIHPTPISKRSQLNIVKEIKLGSWWHPYDDDTELLYQLLVPSIYHQETTLQITSNFTRPAPAPSINSSQWNDNLASQNMEDIQLEEDTETIESVDKADKWHERFHDLLKYRDEHGHCLVPHNWQDNRQLAQWVKRQRYQFKLKSEGKHSTLTENRMKILDKVGFVWNRHSAVWEERYHELVDFARLHGHCHVPSKYPENHQLSVWVRCQRRLYKLGRVNRASTMTRERSLRLLRLGFVFNPRKMNP